MNLLFGVETVLEVFTAYLDLQCLKFLQLHLLSINFHCSGREPRGVLLPSQVSAAVSGTCSPMGADTALSKTVGSPRHTPTTLQVTGMCPMQRCDQCLLISYTKSVQGCSSTDSAWAVKCPPVFSLPGAPHRVSWARFPAVTKWGIHEQLKSPELPKWRSEHPWKLWCPRSFVITDMGNCKKQQIPSHWGRTQRRQECLRIHSHVPRVTGVFLSTRPKFEEIYSTLNYNMLKRKFGPRIIWSYGDCKMGFKMYLYYRSVEGHGRDAEGYSQHSSQHPAIHPAHCSNFLFAKKEGESNFLLFLFCSPATGVST